MPACCDGRRSPRSAHQRHVLVAAAAAAAAVDPCSAAAAARVHAAHHHPSRSPWMPGAAGGCAAPAASLAPAADAQQGAAPAWWPAREVHLVAWRPRLTGCSGDRLQRARPASAGLLPTLLLLLRAAVAAAGGGGEWKFAAPAAGARWWTGQVRALVVGCQRAEGRAKCARGRVARARQAAAAGATRPAAAGAPPPAPAAACSSPGCGGLAPRAQRPAGWGGGRLVKRRGAAHRSAAFPAACVCALACACW